MSLPYPREVETGELRPRRQEPRVTFDVEASVEDAIRASGPDVEVFGVRFAVSEPRTADATVEYYRNAVAQHFNERVSAPDAAIWQLFEEQAHDQVAEHTVLDDHILDVLRLTIDNL
jgi:hypothetical protein